MKKQNTTFQVTVILSVFLGMALIIYGVHTERILDYKDAKTKMTNGMIKKMK